MRTAPALRQAFAAGRPPEAENVPADESGSLREDDARRERYACTVENDVLLRKPFERPAGGHCQALHLLGHSPIAPVAFAGRRSRTKSMGAGLDLDVDRKPVSRSKSTGCMKHVDVRHFRSFGVEGALHAQWPEVPAVRQAAAAACTPKLQLQARLPCRTSLRRGRLLIRRCFAVMSHRRGK